MATKELVLDPMARQKRNDVNVKLDADVVRNAKIVAAYRDITMAEYLSEILRDRVAADLAAHQSQGPLPHPQPPPGRRKGKG